MSSALSLTFPQTLGRTRSVLFDAGIVVSASVVLAVSARAAFSVGPIPFSAQSLAVVLIGAALGGRRAALAVLAYLAQGAAGMPVFAQGAAGLPWMAGPTGGYLLGFVLAAFAVGALVESGRGRSLPGAVAVMALGEALIFACGLAWMTVLAGPRTALLYGFLLFLPATVLKVSLAALLLPQVLRLRGRRE